MEGRKWEELNKDILVNVLGRVGMESLLLDVPFVCKVWYKASLEPQCWEHLIFPRYIKLDDIWEEDSPDRGFAERLANAACPHNFSVTAFVKFIVNRSCGNATMIKLPARCTEETLEHVTNECPKLNALDVGSHNEFMNAIVPKFISKWKNLEMLKVGKFYMKEVLAEIGLHCHKLIWLSAPYNYFQKEEAWALVDSVPQLVWLDLHHGGFDKEALLIILQGCKQLVHLDVRNCFGFEEDDAEILELASHIPTFMCEGSIHLSDIRIAHDLDFDFNDILEDMLEDLNNIESS